MWQSWRLCAWVGVLGLVVLTACRGGENPPSQSLPSVRYALAADGLPMDGMWKSTPALADVNKDGWLDLAALPRLARGARVWFGGAQKAWQEVSTGLLMDVSCGGGVAFGDVNQDGHIDLAVADHCEGVFVYLGNSQGQWRAVTEALNPTLALQEEGFEGIDNPFQGAEDLALGDVNEDGKLDLVVTASDKGGFTVYLGDGSGQGWKEVLEADGLPSGRDPESEDQEQGGWSNRVLLTDINGDGHLDVVASYYTGPRVWRGDGTGRWQDHSTGLARPTTGGLFRGLAVGDIDEDGRMDLVAANVMGGLEIYVQEAEGTWRLSAAAALAGLQGGADAVALGDVDGDRHLDLVVSGSRAKQGTRGLFVFRGDGKAAWTAVENTQLPQEGLPLAWGITLGDMNADRKLDVVVSTGIKPTGVSGALPRSAVGPSVAQLPSSGQPKRKEGSTGGASGASSVQPSQPALPQLQVWLSSGGQGKSSP